MKWEITRRLRNSLINSIVVNKMKEIYRIDTYQATYLMAEAELIRKMIMDGFKILIQA
ncbi:MAG TPA: hypothetical protein HA261_07620 [Methanosarcina sp.]|nr:hypothetical protein [Methanosarcina sp.]